MVLFSTKRSEKDSIVYILSSRMFIVIIARLLFTVEMKLYPQNKDWMQHLNRFTNININMASLKK